MFFVGHEILHLPLIQQRSAPIVRVERFRGSNGMGGLGTSEISLVTGSRRQSRDVNLGNGHQAPSSKRPVLIP